MKWNYYFQWPRKKVYDVWGNLIKLKKNYQVGEVKEIRGKRAIVQIGLLPMSVDLIDLIAVQKIAIPEVKA